MTQYRWLFLAMAAVFTSSYAYESKTEIFEQFDDLRMVAFISDADISANPAWQPDAGAPPLTVAQAINALKEFASTSGADSSLGEIKEIELRIIPKHPESWHYLLKVRNDNNKAKFDIYVVLMSGKVIPAFIEPQAYK